MDRSHRYMHMLHSKSRIDSYKLHSKVYTHKLFNRAYDYKKGKQTYGYKIWNKQHHQAQFRPNKITKLQEIVADISSSITIHQSTKTNIEQSANTVLVEFMIHNKDDSIRFEPSDDKKPRHIDTLSSSKLLVQTNSDIYVLVFLEQGDNTIVRQQLSKQDIFTCVVNMLATPMYPNSLEQLELYKAVQELGLSARNEFSFTLKESVTEKAFSREETRVMTGVYLYLFQQRFTYLYRNRKIKIDTAYLKQCIQDDRLLLSLLFPGGLNKKDKALIGAMATLSTNLVILLSEFYNLFGKNVFSLDVNNLDNYPITNKLYCMDNIQVATLPITQGLTVILPSTGGVVHSAKQHCFNEAGYKDTTTNHITFVNPELLAIVRMSDLVTKDNVLEIDEYFTFVSSTNSIMVQSVMQEVDPLDGNRYTLALLDREAQSSIRYYKVTPEEVGRLNNDGYYSQYTFAVLDEEVQGKLIVYRVIPEIASVLDITQYKDRHSLDLLTKDEEGVVKFHKVASEVVAKMPITIDDDSTTIAVLSHRRQEILRYHQIKPHQVIDMSNLTTYDITYSIVLLDKEAQDVFNTILMIINQAADNHIYHSFKQYIKQVLQDNGIMILDDTIADIMDLFIFYFKNKFIDVLNQSLDREHFLLHPRGKVDESKLCDIRLGSVLLDTTNEESVVLKVDSNLLPVSLHTHKKRVCLVEIDVLFCSAIELFYQMVDREKIILVEQVDQQSNNNHPILLPRLLNELQELIADISSSMTIHKYTNTEIKKPENTNLFKQYNVQFMQYNKDYSIRFEASDDKNPHHIDTLSSSKLLVQTNSDIYVLVFLEQGDNTTTVREQLSKQDIFTCVVNMLATPIYYSSLAQLELYQAVKGLVLLVRDKCIIAEINLITGVYLYLFQQRFTYLYRNRQIKIDTAYLKQCIQEDRLLLSLLFSSGLNKKDKALIDAMATVSTNLVILLSEFYNLFGKNVFSLDVNNLDNYPMGNKLYCMDNIQVATLPITQGLTVVLPSTGGVVHSAKQHCFNEYGYKDTSTSSKQITFVKPELLALVRISELVTKDNKLKIDEYFIFVSSKNSIMLQSVIKEKVDLMHVDNYALALLDKEAQSSIRYYEVTPAEVSRLNTYVYYSQRTFAVLDKEAQGQLSFYKIISEKANILDMTQYKNRYSIDLLNKDEEGIVKFHTVSSEEAVNVLGIPIDRYTIAVLDRKKQMLLRYHQIKPHQAVDILSVTTDNITYSIVLLDKEAQDVFNTILMIINQAADNSIYHSFKQYMKQVLQDNGIVIVDKTLTEIMDLFIFYFKHEFIAALNQSQDRKHFLLHPRVKVDEYPRMKLYDMND